MARRRKKSECEIASYDATKSFIDNFEILVEAAVDCELQESFVEQYQEYINAACDVLKLSEQEVLLLCPFLKNSDKVYDFGDISNFYDCTSMRIMRYMSALKTLQKKGYIKREMYHGRDGLKISHQALETISQGKCMEEATIEEELTPMEFMRKMNDWFEDKRRDNIDLDTLEEEIMNLLRNNLNLNISSRVFDMSMPKEDKIILLYFCKEAVWENEMATDCDDLKNVFDSDGLFAYRKILASEHELVKQGLVEVVNHEGMFGAEEAISLTETAQTDLLKPDFNFIQKTKDKFFHNVLKNDSITAKSLFFGESNKASLTTLKELLDEKRLVDIRQQLQSKGWGLGFTCLFYGAPGTGKTESVLQLA